METTTILHFLDYFVLFTHQYLKQLYVDEEK